MLLQTTQGIIINFPNKRGKLDHFILTDYLIFDKPLIQESLLNNKLIFTVYTIETLPKYSNSD